MVKKLASKMVKQVKKDSENAARVAILQELFNDFNRNRHQVYLMNFVRGIFFGVGSVLGATVVIALFVALLNFFTDLPGGIGGFIQSIVDAMDRRRL